MGKDSKRGKYTSPGGSSFWEYVGTMSCSLMIFSVGCVAGWNSPTLAILMGPDAPIPLTPSEASTLSSMTAMGYALAPLFAMVMADKLGRKKSILISGIPTVISWGLIGATNYFMVFCAARFIGGIAAGLTLCFPSMYLGEIASAKLRGAIGMVCGIMMNAGILFMFVVVPCMRIHTMAYVCCGIGTLATISVWFIPESPYFLAMVGRLDEAEGVLEKLRGKTDVAEELEMIRMSTSQDGCCKEEKRKKSSALFHQLFTVPANRKALCIHLLMISMLHFGGYSCIIFYGHIILGEMNTGISAHICTAIVATLQLVFNILTTFVVDRIGRRPLICISGTASGTCVLFIAIYFYLLEYTKTDVSRYGIFPLCAVFANMVALSVGLMPMQQVLQSEIFATDIKGLATCFVQVTGGLFATIIAKSYLTLVETWGFGHTVPFLGFVLITWIGTALVLKLLPETKGKTLLEIQRDLIA